MASVSVRKLRKDYGKLRILHDVDVDVADGEFVVLVGPSGCGKSTLLRSIAGLETIGGGSIRIGSREVADMPAKDRDVAMVFQTYALYPHMTVAENMGFSMRLKKMSADRIEAEVGRAASILGLAHLLARYPRQLSGGQRQRVAMGRAIVRNPQVFLFDEPLSNLDAKLRVQMRTEIKKLQRTLGATVIYVTHDQVEAMTMADRIVVMRDGVVEQQGAPLALFDRPETAFVAGFIGSPAMNLLPGSISGGATPAFETATGARLPLPAGFAGPEGAVVLGVRPECITLAGEGVPARVELVEPMGSESIVVLDAGGTELQLLLRSRQIVRAGEAVHLAFDRDALHLFDGASGRRLN